MDRIKAFYAYQSTPPDLPETIESAIEKINKNHSNVFAFSWKSLKITGKVIIVDILRAIEESDIFLCDLTYLNSNVLFELGFAIARNKRIWLTINPNIQSSQEKFRRFLPLTTVGYAPYSNSEDIALAFLNDKPYETLDETIFNLSIKKILNQASKPKLLYLMSKTPTEASIKLSELIDSSNIPTIIDDPQEVNIQTLVWYAQHAYLAPSAIAHFLSPTYYDADFHNAKCAFVCGLSYGFDSSVLMLAHEPFESPPIDYRDMLKKHSNGSQCLDISTDWLEEQKRERFGQFFPENRHVDLDSSNLQKLAIGEYVAENEIDELGEYFIQTASFNEAMSANQTLFVGRKGTGKTANFYMLARALEKDKRNHVCLIKPRSYEIKGIIRVLRKVMEVSEVGYLLESLWKFLIYTELAISLEEKIRKKPSYITLDPKEREFLEFLDANRDVFIKDFSLRFEEIVSQIHGIELLKSMKEQRAKVSESLHEEVIRDTRLYLGNLLSNSHKVVVLIDNLDKPWSVEADATELSHFLLGLISVSQDIQKDFRRHDHWREQANVKITIFLRSDIFQQILIRATEPDKIKYERINWHDKELLARVVEKRFNADENSTIDIWKHYFTERVDEQSAKNYILEAILPRPRDLLYFVNQALANAINRGHIRIEEADIKDAENLYSKHAITSLRAEAEVEFHQIEDILVQLAGESEVLTHSELVRCLEKSRVPYRRFTECVDLLCSLSFLGLEVKEGDFRFLYDVNDLPKTKVMADKTKDKLGVKRYKINKPFTTYLELTPNF